MIERHADDIVVGFEREADARRFQVRRKSRGDRMKATLEVVKDGLRRRTHQPTPLQA